MFVLYHSPYSTCSQKVRLVLAEKGIDFTSREISFARDEQRSPEYLKINPNGVVPTLVHDGEPMTDSSCIMEYLDEVAPDPPLSPPSALGRGRCEPGCATSRRCPRPRRGCRRSKVSSCPSFVSSAAR